MWPTTFDARLASWAALRNRIADQPTEQTLSAINTWWFHAPWRAYHLHWDDRDYWPDPWQLLNENIYCPLARGLGIMYTIALLDRADLQDSVLAEHNSDNLVLVGNEKYILNWDRDTIVNIDPGPQHSQHRVNLHILQQKIN